MKSVVRFLLYSVAIFNIWVSQAKTINFKKPANENNSFDIKFIKYVQAPHSFKQSDTIKVTSDTYTIPSNVNLHGTDPLPNLTPKNLSTDSQDIRIVISYCQYQILEKKLTDLKDGTTITISHLPPPPLCNSGKKIGNMCVDIK